MLTTIDISNNNECIICLDNIEDGSLLILDELDTIIRGCKCKGRFHRECFYKWYHNNSTCPICTLEIIVNDLNENEKCCYICLDYEYWNRQEYSENIYKFIKCITYITLTWFSCFVFVVILKIIIWAYYSHQ